MLHSQRFWPERRGKQVMLPLRGTCKRALDGMALAETSLWKVEPVVMEHRAVTWTSVLAPTRREMADPAERAGI